MARNAKTWKWHYFEEVTNDGAECILCGEPFPTYKWKQYARNHLKDNHNDIYESSKHSPEGWQSQFTTQNDKMKCKHCDTPAFNIYTVFNQDMTIHLLAHEINEDKFTDIIRQAYEKMYDPNNQREVHTCKMCPYKSSPNTNSSNLIKHLMEHHQSIIPAEMRPKRLRELSGPSNYDREASIATSSNYQQPNQLRELSGPSNYDREASIATSSNYQQPNVDSLDSNRLGELNNSDREAGVTTTSNCQEPNQLGELSSSSNYDGRASITTTDDPCDGSQDLIDLINNICAQYSNNHQQPNVYSLDSDRSNDFSDLLDAPDDGS